MKEIGVTVTLQQIDGFCFWQKKNRSASTRKRTLFLRSGTRAANSPLKRSELASIPATSSKFLASLDLREMFANSLTLRSFKCLSSNLRRWIRRNCLVPSTYSSQFLSIILWKEWGLIHIFWNLNGLGADIVDLNKVTIVGEWSEKIPFGR